MDSQFTWVALVWFPMVLPIELLLSYVGRRKSDWSNLDMWIDLTQFQYWSSYVSHDCRLLQLDNGMLGMLWYLISCIGVFNILIRHLLISKMSMTFWHSSIPTRRAIIWTIKKCIAMILQWINSPHKWCNNHLGSTSVIFTSFLQVVYPLKNANTACLNWSTQVAVAI